MHQESELFRFQLKQKAKQKSCHQQRSTASVEDYNCLYCVCEVVYTVTKKNIFPHWLPIIK